MRNVNPRVTRWALTMQPLTFAVAHQPGIRHSIVDGMSWQSKTEKIEHEDPVADLKGFQGFH
jgi:hypothetical protein